MLRLKKFVSLLFILLPCLAFGDEWEICLGSFNNFENAKTRLEILKNSGIPVYLTDYSQNYKIFYRVMYEEKFTDLQTATFHQNMISNLPVVKNLKISDVWCVHTVTEEKSDSPAKPANVIVPETRKLTIKDSDSGNPVPDANVNIDEKWDVSTDEAGKASVPNEVPDGEHSIVVTKGNTYVPTSGHFTLQNDDIISTPQISVPKAVDYSRIKIVLDWGEWPYDLDSHILSSSAHVFFVNMSQENLNLDRDDTSSYGPETVTIREPKASETYRYYVFNYSDEGRTDSSRLSNSGARVKVFLDNDFVKEFNVPQDKEGLLWHVFDIKNGNEIVVCDEITTDALYTGDIK